MTLFAWLGTGSNSRSETITFYLGLLMAILAMIFILLLMVRLVFKSAKTVKTSNRWYVKVLYLVIGIVAAYVAGMIIFTLT